MLDFTAVNKYEVPMSDFSAHLWVTDLRQLTHQTVERLLLLLAQCA